MFFAPYAKAVVAFFAPTVTVVVGTVEESLRVGSSVNWKLIAVTAVISLWGSLVVWAVPNTPKGDSNGEV